MHHENNDDNDDDDDPLRARFPRLRAVVFTLTFDNSISKGTFSGGALRVQTGDASGLPGQFTLCVLQRLGESGLVGGKSSFRRRVPALPKIVVNAVAGVEWRAIGQMAVRALDELTVRKKLNPSPSNRPRQ